MCGQDGNHKKQDGVNKQVVLPTLFTSQASGDLPQVTFTQHTNKGRKSSPGGDTRGRVIGRQLLCCFSLFESSSCKGSISELSEYVELRNRLYVGRVLPSYVQLTGLF